MKGATNPREQKIAEAKAQDKPLISELTHRLAHRVRPLPELRPFCEFGKTWSIGEIESLEALLQTKGTFDLVTTHSDWQDLDGEKHSTLVLRAALTNAWPMGTHWWGRDNALVAARLLEAGKSSLVSAEKFGTFGKELLLSLLTVFSTESQLQRFQNVIEAKNDEFVHQRENWPQIFLDIKNNLNGAKHENWSHKQDAWQMAAYYTVQALEQGNISIQDLTEKHKKFLGLALPFLAKVQYWQAENSGSWEELAGVRSSVIAWDVATIAKIGAYAQRTEGGFLLEAFEAEKEFLPAPYRSLSLFSAAAELVERGKQALRKRMPYESPNYDSADPRYREADATLIYLLQLDMPTFLEEPALEARLLEQIERLTDNRMGAIRRYLNDSYQGKGFFQNETVFYLTEMYGAPGGDASGVEQWVSRRKIVPTGPEAAWTHFVWQMSAWAGKRHGETHDKKYFALQQEYFTRGLKLITGNNEASLEQTPDGSMRVFDVPAWRIPEAYLTDEGPNGEELIFPSPHTPLNWAVGEAIYALAMMKRSLELA